LGSASNKADASTSTPKRKKVARDDAALNTSPAMNTRRQLALSKQAEAGTSQEVSTTPNMEVATPTKKKIYQKEAGLKEGKEIDAVVELS